MTEETYKWHEIPIYSVKGSRKFIDINARLLFYLYETSTTSRIMENDCNIALFLIAANWFLRVIKFEVFGIWFLKSAV